MLNFSFTNGERNGIIILIVIVVLFAGSRYYIKNYVKPNNDNFDISEFSEDINSFETAVYNEQKAVRKSKSKQKQTNLQGEKLRFYTFNPNTASIRDWQNFGFSKKQAKTIIKFIKSGKGIETPEDLKKIYIISDEKYLQLKPYIKIPPKEEKQNKPPKNKKTPEHKTVVKIELNTSTVAELVKVKGIGKKTAQRIIKYRDLLGGYVSVEQLNEVYGITEENFNRMKKGLKINRLKIKKISVNFSEKQDLSKHPYISFKQAQAIIDYRTKNGAFKSVNQLFDLKLVTNEYLRYYLSLN